MRIPEGDPARRIVASVAAAAAIVVAAGCSAESNQVHPPSRTVSSSAILSRIWARCTGVTVQAGNKSGQVKLSSSMIADGNANLDSATYVFHDNTESVTQTNPGSVVTHQFLQAGPYEVAVVPNYTSPLDGKKYGSIAMCEALFDIQPDGSLGPVITRPAELCQYNPEYLLANDPACIPKKQ